MRAVSFGFPEHYRARGQARIELHFPQAVVQARLDGLLPGGGEAVGLRWVGGRSPRRDTFEALGFCLQGFVRKNGLHPRLLLVTPHQDRPLPWSLPSQGSAAYRKVEETLRRGVEALRQGARVPGPACRGCPFGHDCAARVV